MRSSIILRSTGTMLKRGLKYGTILGGIYGTVVGLYSSPVFGIVLGIALGLLLGLVTGILSGFFLGLVLALGDESASQLRQLRPMMVISSGLLVLFVTLITLHWLWIGDLVAVFENPVAWFISQFDFNALGLEGLPAMIAAIATMRVSWLFLGQYLETRDDDGEGPSGVFLASGNERVH